MQTSVPQPTGKVAFHVLCFMFYEKSKLTFFEKNGTFILFCYDLKISSEVALQKGLSGDEALGVYPLMKFYFE